MYHPHRASPPPNQSSFIPAFNLDDDDFDPLWSFASQPLQYTKGPSKLVEDDSPIEKVAVVKPKRKYTRRRQSIKKNDKECVESWTPEEESTLVRKWKNRKEAMIPLTANEKIRFVLRAKKKGSSSGARLESSVASDPSLVDALLSKFTMAATPFFRQGKNPPLSI
nr:hypothetical protein [Tanacetum cinerariifolium]